MTAGNASASVKSVRRRFEVEKGARVWVMRASSGSFGCVARDETASYFAQDDRVWAGRERSLRVVRYIPVVRTEMAVAMYTKLIDPGAHVVVEGIVNLDCR